MLISEGDHMLIYIFVFFYYYFIVGHCTALPWLVFPVVNKIRRNFGKTLWNNIVDYRLQTLSSLRGSESRARQPLSRMNLTGFSTGLTCVKPVKFTPAVL